MRRAGNVALALVVVSRHDAPFSGRWHWGTVRLFIGIPERDLSVDVSYECTVQAGDTTLELQAELARELICVATDVLGAPDGASSVDFVELAQGSGFTGGEPSSTSIVKVQLPADCAYSTRKVLMSELCALWYDKTGCSADELVVFTSDRPSGG